MTENQRGTHREMAFQDFAEKLAKRDKRLQYYPKKIVDFDLKTMDRFLQYSPNPSKLMKMGVTFAHRDLEIIADAMANNKSWAVVSGLNPSGPLHFGHKQVFEDLLWCQQQGAEIFIPITNDETYLVGKTKTLAESRRIAYRDVIPSIIAMGFKPDKTHIFVDSDYKDIYNVAIDVSKELTLNRIFGVFGFGKDEEGENPGTLFYRGGVQLAQILLPQYQEFGGNKPTLIPVGIDQYPYILLARDIAKKKHFTPPAAIFTKFEDGLDGKGKMSSSRPDSSLFLTDSPKEAQNKLKLAYTGGSILADFQKEYGGIPEICPIFQLRSYHFEGNEKLETQCKKGEILCSQCKKEATKEIVNYLNDHQKKITEVKDKIDEFILSTPINSILK